jgi:FKBP-type peptidyl-prolyl cis-trans isomerase SlyD
MKITPIIVAAALLFSCSDIPAQTKKDENVIKDGSRVSLDFTLTDEKGNFIQSSKGNQPLRYTHGRSEIIPELERSLAGMATGAERRVRIKPEDAYGQVDPKLFEEVPKEKLPPDALKVGTLLLAKDPQGKEFEVRVHEIKDKTVVMNHNHPLAGKTLVFDIKILDIKPAAAR